MLPNCTEDIPSTSLQGTIQEETVKLLRWKMETDMRKEEYERKQKMTEGLAERQRDLLLKLEGEKAELNERLINLEVEKDQLYHQVIYTRGELEVHSAQLELFTNQLNRSKVDGSNKQKEMGLVENSLTDLSYRFQNLNNNHDEKIGEIRSRINLLETEKQKSTETLVGRIGALKEKLNLTHDKVKTLEEKVNLIGQDLLEKSQILFGKENIIIKLKEALNMENKKKKDSEDISEKELNLVSIRVEELKSDIGSLNAEISDLENSHVREKLDIQDILSSIDQLTQEKAGLIKSNEDLINLNNFLSTKSKMLLKDVEEVREDNNLLQVKMAELEKLKEEYKIANSELSASEERNKDLKNQVRNLSRVRKEKLELNTRVLDLEKQIYETRETYETYETQAEDELKKGKQAMEDGIRQELERSSEREAEIASYVSRIKKARETNLLLQSDIAVIDEKLEAVNKERNKVEKEMKIMVQSRTETMKKNELLRERLAKIRSDGETALKQKSDEIQGLKDFVKNRSKYRTAESGRVHSMQGILFTLTEELKRKRSLVLENQRRIQEVQKKSRKLEELKKKNTETMVAEERREVKVRIQLEKYTEDLIYLETSIQDAFQEKKIAEQKTQSLLQQRESQKELRKRLEKVEVETSQLDTVVGELQEKIKENEKVELEKREELSRVEEEDREERARIMISIRQKEEVSRKNKEQLEVEISDLTEKIKDKETMLKEKAEEIKSINENTQSKGSVVNQILKETEILMAKLENLTIQRKESPYAQTRNLSQTKDYSNPRKDGSQTKDYSTLRKDGSQTKDCSTPRKDGSQTKDYSTPRKDGSQTKNYSTPRKDGPQTKDYSTPRKDCSTPPRQLSTKKKDVYDLDFTESSDSSSPVQLGDIFHTKKTETKDLVSRSQPRVQSLTTPTTRISNLGRYSDPSGMRRTPVYARSVTPLTRLGGGATRKVNYMETHEGSGDDKKTGPTTDMTSKANKISGWTTDESELE